MTSGEFFLGLLADSLPTADGRDRVRYIIAREFESYARVRRVRDKRPDRAGLCTHIASQLNAGRPPSKRVLKKAAKEIAFVEMCLVDDQPVAGR